MDILIAVLYQFGIIVLCLSAAAGFYTLFFQGQLIRWPWHKKVATPTEGENVFRKGRAAGVYYYASTLDQLGVHDLRAVDKEYLDKLHEAAQQIAPELREHFKAGALEGQALITNVVHHFRADMLVVHIPDMQRRLTDAADLLREADRKMTGHSARKLVQDVRKIIQVLRGAPQ